MSRKNQQKAKEGVPQGPVTPGSTLHTALQLVARAVAERLSASRGAATTTAARARQPVPRKPKPPPGRQRNGH